MITDRSRHVVPASQLLNAISKLTEKFGPRLIMPNAVGNLAVLTTDGEYVGWLDLGEGCTFHAVVDDD